MNESPSLQVESSLGRINIVAPMQVGTTRQWYCPNPHSAHTRPDCLPFAQSASRLLTSYPGFVVSISRSFDFLILLQCFR